MSLETNTEKINKTSLRDMSGITNSTSSRLLKDVTVSRDALARICEVLKCGLEDIVKYKLEKNGKE